LENEHWQNFFRELRPAFKIPSPQRIGSELYDSEYKHVMELSI
jgi:hypothetical protein